MPVILALQKLRWGSIIHGHPGLHGSQRTNKQTNKKAGRTSPYGRLRIPGGMKGRVGMWTRLETHVQPGSKMRAQGLAVAAPTHMNQGCRGVDAAAQTC